jgi:hypothetical protein
MVVLPSRDLYTSQTSYMQSHSSALVHDADVFAHVLADISGLIAARVRELRAIS